MRKKRILFCSEATFLNTGYATWTREIMKYLHSTGKYELAEMASYGQRNDPRAANIPWKYYGVQPNKEFEPKASKEEIDMYESHPTNQFGAMLFEHVCLDFKPDIVFDIRDFWMLEYQERSPFRDYYNWVIMPTVDAAPQARQWIATYASADAVFSYSEWSGKVMEEQSGGKIKYQNSAPPSANPEYKPMDKGQCRELIGLNKNDKIIGTVMRNQRRKLYPDLFAAFNLFLDEVDNPEQYKLYCHTAYPDLGWNIPELLNQHALSSKVYFTYQCQDTKQIFASLFCGPVCESPFTGKFNAKMCSVQAGADYKQLATIMNCFDLYVQYANSEGFGLPQVEAAACKVPVMSTDYSAMSSVVRNLKGIPIQPKTLYKELETGCMRAVPDNPLAASEMLKFFNLSEKERQKMGEKSYNGFKAHYQWEISGERLSKCFDELSFREEWSSASPKINIPKEKPREIPPNTSPKDLAKWLIVEVLGDTSKLNTYFETRLTRDLLYGQTTASTGGMYGNDSSAYFDGKLAPMQFNFDMAYQEMVKMANHRNSWEKRRIEKFNKGS